MNQDTLDEVFCEGRNVEEALQAACDRLNTTPNQVEHEVVREGSNGGVLAFLKGRTTRIRVWKKSAEQVRLTETLRGFFDRLGLVSEFKVTRAEDAYEITIDTDGSDGLLIGRGGETLAALQHLVARMASRIDEDMRVRVDVAGYRKRRQDQLRKKALELAEKALSSGKESVTEPLPADERRIVHLALSDDSRVETHAIGEGLTKRIVVSPVAGGARATGRAEERGANRRSGGHGSHRAHQEGDEGSGHGAAPRHGDRSRRRSGRGSGTSGAGSRERGGEGVQSGEREDARGEGARGPSGRGSGAGRGRERSGGRSEGRRGRERGGDPGRGRSSEAVASASHRERSREQEQEERPRVDRPAADEPQGERGREPKPAGNLPPVEDSYFKIPESIGLISSPSRQAAEGESAEGDAAEAPRTFGRRPRAGRGRRR